MSSVIYILMVFICAKKQHPLNGLIPSRTQVNQDQQGKLTTQDFNQSQKW